MIVGLRRAARFVLFFFLVRERLLEEVEEEEEEDEEEKEEEVDLDFLLFLCFFSLSTLAGSRSSASNIHEDMVWGKGGVAGR